MYGNGQFCPSVASIVRLRTFLRIRDGRLETEWNSEHDSMHGHIEAARRDRIRNDIAHRIKRSCSHLDENDFQRLVEEMTERQVRGERRVTRDYLLE